jgi:lipoate---protein ligase
VSAGSPWLVEQRTASAADLHGLWPAEEDRSRRIVRRCRVAGATALVLGSSQSEQTVDHRAIAAAGVEPVRRRSGGGAVIVAPDAQLWFDVWIPRPDPLWQDDVVRSAFWLGETWAAALRSLEARDVSVHRRRLGSTSWSALVCFAASGPGEVSVGSRKVVGISQRRTGAGALLHSVALLEWDSAAVPGLLALAPEDRHRAVIETAPAAAGLGEVLPARRQGAAMLDAVARAVLDHLPDRQLS